MLNLNCFAGPLMNTQNISKPLDLFFALDILRFGKSACWFSIEIIPAIHDKRAIFFPPKCNPSFQNNVIFLRYCSSVRGRNCYANGGKFANIWRKIPEFRRIQLDTVQYIPLRRNVIQLEQKMYPPVSQNIFTSQLEVVSALSTKQ